MSYLLKGVLTDTNNLFGLGTSRIVARNFRCSGAETRLSSCSYSAIAVNSGISYQWPWYNPVGIICQGNTLAPTECEHGDVRLVNGLKETQGRVEVCAYGYWAIVCDGNWNTAATRLVCKQLGLPTEGMHVCMILYSMDNNNYYIQHLITCLVVHLDQTINCLLLGFTVAVEPEMSASVKYTIRQVIAITEELLVYSAKVYS